jgi:hypothetical protein
MQSCKGVSLIGYLEIMAKRLIYVLLIISMCFCSVEAVSQDIFLHGISKKNLKHNQNRLDSSFSNYSIFEYQSTESLKSVSNKGQIEMDQFHLRRRRYSLKIIIPPRLKILIHLSSKLIRVTS